MLVFALFLSAFNVPRIAHGQETKFHVLNPSSLPPAHGYSHIVIALRGRLVSISGRASIDSTGKVVGKGDFESQCVQQS